MGNFFARFFGEIFLTFRPPFGVDRRRRDLEGEAVIDWSRVSIIKYLSIQSRISVSRSKISSFSEPVETTIALRAERSSPVQDTTKTTAGMAKYNVTYPRVRY